MKRVDREAVNSEIKIQAGRAGISKEMLTGYEGQRVKGTLNNFTIPMPDRVSAEKKRREHTEGPPGRGGHKKKDPPPRGPGDGADHRVGLQGEDRRNGG